MPLRFGRLIYVIVFNFSSLPMNYTNCLKMALFDIQHALRCPCLQYGTSQHVAHIAPWIIVDPPPATNWPSINFSGPRSTSSTTTTAPPITGHSVAHKGADVCPEENGVPWVRTGCTAVGNRSPGHRGHFFAMLGCVDGGDSLRGTSLGAHTHKTSA